jgi:RNA polymerase-binding transcription factor DksA
MSTNAASNPGAERRLAELTAERDRAAEQVARLTEEYDTLLGESGGLQEDRDNTRTLLELARRNLDEATAALDALADGSDRRCERCGDPIAPERLEALPGTTVCVACKDLV